jgi:7,8-dihydro-6-hydroxymethylpterin-pyrophosphokinase
LEEIWGNRQAHSAVSELRAIGQVVRDSSPYDSAPRDAFNQPRFLSAALELGPTSS